MGSRTRLAAWASTLALLVASIPLGAGPAAAATDGLFFSEYIEGTSFNKALEIYNGTGAAVDLAAGGYSVQMFFNGSTTAGLTINLTGTVADGDVHVVAQASANATVLAQADQTNGAGWFNGDDAVVLRQGTETLDVIGQIGLDPGSEWGSGLTSTADNTLARLETVCAGDPDGSNAFDPAVEWTGFATDTFTGLGTHTASCDGPVEDAAPAVASTTPADGGDISPTENLVVTFTEPVAVAPGGFTLVCTDPIDVTVSGGTTSYTLDPATDLVAGENCTLTVSAASVTDLDGNDPPDAMAGDVVVTFGVQNACAAVFTPIPSIQGSGLTAAITGTVTTQGVVVGDYEGPSPTLRGFYLQDPVGDGDPTTSDGIFVFNGNNDSVGLGDVVRVTGTAAEFQDQTQISASSVVDCGTATLEPVQVELPFPSAEHLERYEGMLVELPQTLYVTEYFQLGRFGEVVVSSGDRLGQPTDIAEPGAPAIAVQAANNLNRLKIDDATNVQNPDPIIFSLDGAALSESNAFRGGDTITGAVGVMTYTWAGNAASPNAYRLRPVNALGAEWDFESRNPRPSGTLEVGGTATVAAFNVLNYYVTIDAGPDVCGPGLDQDCRGADSALELERQRVKLLEALDRLDAEVVGLVELENTTGVEAMADIVAGLNVIPDGPEYDYIETGTIGTDAIKVGLIYQTGAVTPLGDHAILDSSVDPTFDDDLNRPALAQSFTSDDGEVFTVVVNHLKSKGCGDAVGAEADQGDGQGCWNPARTAAAEALVDWLGTDPTGSGDPDVFVIGDLNSYAKEDPIDVFVDAGYLDLGRAFEGDDHYTYVFDGQWGYLDYALASPSVAARVTGAGSYHINADEIPVLDYNTDFKSLGQVTSLFAPNEFRTSDHDPVILGLCDAVAPTASATASPSQLWPPNNQMVDVTVTLDVFDASGADVELVSVTKNEPDWNPRRGPDIVIVDDTTFQLRASRLGSGDGRIYTITYSAVDACGNETVFTTEVTVPHDQGN